jgi:dTDP-4-amino-4,6-dideoxygalactose transaminase
MNISDKILKIISRKCSWYPPAETKIPFSTLFAALLPFKADFRNEICRYLEVDQCICAESGRALLTLVLQALSKRNGMQQDEVLIPGYTCYSVAASVVRAGLRIGVYDLDPKTLQPDIDSVKRAINNKTIVIVAQHLFGIPSTLNELKCLARDVGAYTIEDAAQAIGGSLNGCQLGKMADFGFFSFGRGKPLPLGCGGVLIGKDPLFLHEIHPMKVVRGYGRLFATAVAQILSHDKLYGIMEALPLGLGETIFNPNFLISSMPLVMQRLGTRTLGTLKTLNAYRRTIAGIYSDLLKDYENVPVQEGAYPIYTRFPLMAGSKRIPQNLKRFGVRRMYPKALVDEPAIRRFFADKMVRTPGASRIAERLITLPTHTGISQDIAETIAIKLQMGFGHPS